MVTRKAFPREVQKADRKVYSKGLSTEIGWVLLTGLLMVLKTALALAPLMVLKMALTLAPLMVLKTALTLVAPMVWALELVSVPLEQEWVCLLALLSAALSAWLSLGPVRVAPLEQDWVRKR